MRKVEVVGPWACVCVGIVPRGISHVIYVSGSVTTERGRMKRPKYINRPFTRLPLKQRACFILHLAGFTQREMLRVLSVASFKTINAYIKHGIEEYGENGVANYE